MRARRLASLLIAPLALVTLAACAPPSPPPSPSPQVSSSPAPVAEPTTLEELATTLTDEGVADLVTLRETTGPTAEVQVALSWSGPATTQQQLDAYAEVDARIDALLADRPEATSLSIGSSTSDFPADERLTTTFDPGEQALRELLDVVHGTPCLSALLEEREEGEGPFTLLQLDCSVPVEGFVALVSSYDEITAIHPAPDVVDQVRWQLREETDTDSYPVLRVDRGPVEGRQQQLVDAMAIADGGVLDLLSIVDDGDAVTVGGTTDPSQTDLCDAIAAPLVAAGVRATVQLQDDAATDPTIDDIVCRTSA